MNLSRRELILSGLSLPLAGIPRIAMSANDTANTLFFVIDRIDEIVSPDLAQKVLNIFLARGIPLAVTMNCSRDDPRSRELMKVIKEIAAREIGLIELVLEITPSIDPERYFQLRNAIELRDCVQNGEITQAVGWSSTPIVSVIDRARESVLDPYALRAAGFRIQLHPKPIGEDGEINSESRFSSIDWGIAQLKGGIFISIESNPKTAFASLDKLSPQAFYLTFKNASDMDDEGLLTKCADWAEKLQSSMVDDGVFITRPMDYLLQGNPGASKYVGLVLDMTQSTEDTEHLAGFASKLDQAGFPYTILNTDEVSTGILTGEKYTVPTALRSGDQATEIVYSSNVTDGDETQDAQVDVRLRLSDDRYLWSGPRDDGWYHAVLQTDSAQHFARSIEEDPMTDVILLFEASQVITLFHQETIIRQFEQARNDGKAHFYTLGEYVEQTVAPDSVLEHFWSTRRRQIPTASNPQSFSELERSRLEEDAKLAWQYIERFTDKNTGLCAGTVQTGTEDVINREITMWDVASQLNGIAAASSLAIITTSEAQERVALILNNLPSKNIDGLSLPPSLFRADNPSAGRKEFDACDTGRFLIALERLVESELTTERRAQSFLEGWNLATTVKDQRPHSYSGGVWEDVINSHCSHYARNGYIHWGIPMETPYPALSDMESGDQKIRLLYKAAFIGHFGSEPLLLEGLEVGYSPETRYLSEVLFEAQLSWFEDTGQLKCVSEAPLNFAPWFSYQGLRVDRSGLDAWVISTVGHNTEFQTEQFFRKADIISSKAAFMWAAEFPHAYSSRLLRLTREKARIDGLGYSVGIFNNSLEPMKGYSDVNTNGIILTAIAKMLAVSLK